MNPQLIAKCFDTVPTTIPELKARHESLCELVSEVTTQYPDLRAMPEAVCPVFADALQLLATTTVSLEATGVSVMRPTGLSWFEDMLAERRRTLAMIEAMHYQEQGKLYH
jgi:hypothetical protein